MVSNLTKNLNLIHLIIYILFTINLNINTVNKVPNFGSEHDTLTFNLNSILRSVSLFFDQRFGKITRLINQLCFELLS